MTQTLIVSIEKPAQHQNVSTKMDGELGRLGVVHTVSTTYVTEKMTFTMPDDVDRSWVEKVFRMLLNPTLDQTYDWFSN